MKIKLSEYVMVAEAAAILGVSQGTIRTWAEAGDSQCTKCAMPYTPATQKHNQ